MSDQFRAEVHGFHGIIGVSVPGAGRATDDRVIAVTRELEEFPFQIDMNSGEHLGIGAYCRYELPPPLTSPQVGPKP